MQAFSIDAGEFERRARRSEPTVAPPAADAADPIARHIDATFRFARTLGADRDLASDLTQEAFVVAWRKGKQDLAPAALAAYLRRTTRYLWLQTRRRDRRAEAAIAALTERRWLERANAAGDQHGTGDELVATARQCVDRLEGRAAAAVRLSYGQGRSRPHIATALGLTPNGVKTLLARTRRWLALCIRQGLRDDCDE
ncbi:MAG: sigma-70 family RNA polymerase sigma factor [bacterium]|nr:sigma-70 family RNA polymerase sigma factor [bacterium]